MLFLVFFFSFSFVTTMMICVLHSVLYYEHNSLLCVRVHPTQMQIQFISLIDSYELFNRRDRERERDLKKHSKLHDFKPEWIDFHCSFFFHSFDFIHIYRMWFAARSHPLIHTIFFSLFFLLFPAAFKSIHAASKRIACHSIVCDEIYFMNITASSGQVHLLRKNEWRKNNV